MVYRMVKEMKPEGQLFPFVWSSGSQRKESGHKVEESGELRLFSRRVAGFE